MTRRTDGSGPAVPRGRKRGERGSVSMEMTMLVWPVTVLTAAFIAGGWTLATARQDVHAAAGSAARAAALQDDPAAAEHRVHADLAGAGRSCADLTVNVDTSRFAHGGEVAVAVRCDADLRGLSGLDLPGSLGFEASASAPIESHRELQVGQ